MCGTWSGDCCMGAVARVFRSSCRRGFRLQAEAFRRIHPGRARYLAVHREGRGFRLQAEAFHRAAWSAHGAGLWLPSHASTEVEWLGARGDCSLAYDLARSPRRVEITERCVRPGPL